MARNYPAYTQTQNFYQEQYENEMYNRLRSFYAKERGGGGGINDLPPIGYRGKNLPNMNPAKFARDMARKEREELQKTIAEAKQHQCVEEMKKAAPKVQAKLYDGFSREGKGKAAYLKDRYQTIPENKYSFPVLSSWKYGWQLDSSVALQKPKYARSKMIMDTFYTRNGIPDVQPQAPYSTF